MTNDWEITHVHADLTPEIWDFIKKNRFFGMIVPKEYGGLGFSALGNHKVIQKLASISTVVSSTVGVPNSLGPAELLMHYGTQEQKDYYLPRLADGREVPCFGLTGPWAGSDATSIPDFGIVTMGDWNGARVVGVKLTFDKRYITLAPVATLIGLAFRMYDPDGLLGDKRDIGITLALLPRDTAGRGSRPSPLPAQLAVPERPDPRQGSLHPAQPADRRRSLRRQGLADAGRVPVDRPLDHAALHRQRRRQDGRGSHRRLRAHPQAVRPVDRPLRRRGRSAGPHRRQGLRDQRAVAKPRRPRSTRGELPAVPSTIAKYHCTEMGREVATDAMDIHGGKGIILGPKNYARPRLAGRADRDHGGRREHHDALADDLRPGRDPVPSVGAEGNEGGEPARSGRAPAPSSTATCSATSASPSPTRCAAGGTA